MQPWVIVETASNDSMALRGDVVAAAGDETFGEQVSVNPAPHFARLAGAVHPDTRYLNSGLFLCRSAAFLEDWFRLCLTMPVEKLFEQNAFNLAAQLQPDRVRVLDMMTWNMCGPQLRGATIEASGLHVAVSGSHGRTAVLHATSNMPGEVVVQRLRLRINTTVFKVAVKTFARSEMLRTFQRELFMDALAENFQHLTDCGFGTDG